MPRWQHPLLLRTPNGTGAKAPSKSANGSRANRRWEQGAKAPAAARNLISPFPFPLRGKPGREGSPHAAKSAAPPTRGLRPLVNPPQDFPRGYLTGAGLLMEAVTVGSGAQFFNNFLGCFCGYVGLDIPSLAAHIDSGNEIRFPDPFIGKGDYLKEGVHRTSPQ